MNRQKVLPPVWFLLSIMSMIGLHLWLPVKQLLFSPITYLGIVAITTGIGMVLFCAYLFRQKETTIKPCARIELFSQRRTFQLQQKSDLFRNDNYFDWSVDFFRKSDPCIDYSCLYLANSRNVY